MPRPPVVIRVWICQLIPDNSWSNEQFSNHEQASLANISTNIRRRQFASARLLLKHQLSQSFNCQAKEVEIEVGENGKPFCRHPRYAQISIAHTQDYAVIAEAPVAIGIDYEWIKPGRDTRAIAAQYFTKDEYTWICGATTKQQRNSRFYQLWVLKEAYGKATGEGLSSTLNIDLHAEVMPESNLAPVAGVQLFSQRDKPNFWLGIAALTERPIQVTITNVDLLKTI